MRTCKPHIPPRNVYNKTQGSILGPLLFSIFVNDLPMCLTPPVQCDLFAGDGTLNTADDNIHNRRTDLQLRLNDISDGVVEIRWYSIQPKQNAWRQKHQKQQLSFNLNFETTPIAQVLKHRPLGATADKQIKWQTHINNMRRIVS